MSKNKVILSKKERENQKRLKKLEKLQKKKIRENDKIQQLDQKEVASQKIEDTNKELEK